MEAKAQEKLRAQGEELEEKKRKEEDGEGVRRRVEGRGFEGTAMELRHQGRLARAHMLATAAAPKLVRFLGLGWGRRVLTFVGKYYLPWKLEPGEEERIKEQVETVEVEIARERREFEVGRVRDQEELLAFDGAVEDEEMMDSAPVEELGEDFKAVHNADTADALDTAPAPEPEIVKEEGAGSVDLPAGDMLDDKDMEDPAEEIIEGGEDTVIY